MEYIQKNWVTFFQCGAAIGLILLPTSALNLFTIMCCPEQMSTTVNLLITVSSVCIGLILNTSLLHLLLMSYNNKTISWRMLFHFHEHKQFIGQALRAGAWSLLTSFVWVIGSGLILLLPIAVSTLAQSIDIGAINFTSFDTKTMLTELIASGIFSTPTVISFIVLLLVIFIASAWFSVINTYSIIDYMLHPTRSYFESLKNAMHITQDIKIKIWIYSTITFIYFLFSWLVAASLSLNFILPGILNAVTSVIYWHIALSMYKHINR